MAYFKVRCVILFIDNLNSSVNFVEWEMEKNLVLNELDERFRLRIHYLSLIKIPILGHIFR